MARQLLRDKIIVMAKIMLIDPPGWQGASEGNRPFPNVGLAYLVPALREAGHEVSALDLNNEAMTDEAAVARVREVGPDLIGFSVKTATFNGSKRLGSLLKESLPKTPIVLGGPHVSIAWPDLVGESWVDYLFLGEGERDFPKLCHDLCSDAGIEHLSQVIAASASAPSPSPQICLIDDLDALPFPEFDPLSAAAQAQLAEAYPLVTSRGCVYKCVYCSVPQISGRRFRKRSVDKVIEELRLAREQFGTSGFEIIDDAFNVDLRHCKKLCRALIDSGLDMSWSCPNGIRVDRVDAELAGLMSESGCGSVMVGVESAVPEVLAAVNKGETVEDVEAGIRILQAAGIEVGGYFIIGLPGDSYARVERSLEFALSMGIRAHFNLLAPYPGTELWGWAEEHGRFLGPIEDAVHFSSDPVSLTPTFDTVEFPAAERVRAYEMAHTRLRAFDMVVPQSDPQWKKRARIFKLLWRHDRENLAGYIFERAQAKLGSDRE